MIVNSNFPAFIKLLKIMKVLYLVSALRDDVAAGLGGGVEFTPFSVSNELSIEVMNI